METMEQINNKQVFDDNKANDAIAKEEPGLCFPDKDSKKKLLDSLVGHITEFFKKFSNEDGSLRNPANQEIIDLGRDEEERQQIEEFCNDIDEQNKLLEELQEFKAKDQNNTAQDWLRLKGKNELNDCTPEEKEAILLFVNDQQDADIQGNVEALENVLENAELTDSEIIKKEEDDE